MKKDIEEKRWDMVFECVEEEDMPKAKALKAHLEKVGFTVTRIGVIKSPWDEDNKLDALQWVVTIGTHSFNFYGSHNDAQAFKTFKRDTRRDFFKDTNQHKKAQEKVNIDIYYSILCSIGMDLYCPELFEDFCLEFGYDDDSIKSRETFEKCYRHARDLRKQGLTHDLHSFPA